MNTANKRDVAIVGNDHREVDCLIQADGRIALRFSKDGEMKAEAIFLSAQDARWMAKLLVMQAERVERAEGK